MAEETSQGRQAEQTARTEFLHRQVPFEETAWALRSLCQIYRIPFDAQLLEHRFPPPHDVAELLHAARALGFEPSAEEVSGGRLARNMLPAIAIRKAESEAEGSPVQANGLIALVTAADQERVQYFQSGSDQAVESTTAEFEAAFEDRVLVLPRVDERGDTDEPEADRPAFGFRWFVPELLRHRRIWRDVLLASFAIQLFGLSVPIFTQVVIDKVIVHQTMSTLTVIAVGLFAFMVFSGVMTWIRQYMILHTGNRIDAVLGSRVFQHLFNLPARYFEHRPTGTVIARVQGVETIRQFLSGAAVSLFLDLPFLFLFVAVMFYYNWRLTLVALAILFTITVLSLAITPTLRKRLNEQFLLGARNQAFLTEYVNGVETVKSLQVEPQINRTYGDYLASYLGSSFRTRNLGNTYNTLVGSLEQFQTLGILVLGAWTVMQNTGFTVGMLVAFQMFASRLSAPVMRLAGLWQEFQQASIAVRRLGDIMDAPSEPFSLSPARHFKPRGEIRIEGLAFRYNDNLPYLYRDLDISIPAGSSVVISGPSGSGKSTLVKLLQGFYQPTAGRIRIDGLDISYMGANILRSYFGVVPQETMLFSGTVYENLAIANPGATFEMVIQACRMAQVHETIEHLPEGYQTKLGEHGAGLSGGQRQRLAIARALLKRPKILLFDEATSNLDKAISEDLARTINRLKGKVTIVFITHHKPDALAVDQTISLHEPPAAGSGHLRAVGVAGAKHDAEYEPGKGDPARRPD